MLRQTARSLTLSLCLGLTLACSSTERSTADVAAPTDAHAQPSFAEQRPHVGDPAPTISLTSLAGERVSLPMFAADRAAVLIFGSFS
jgi:hypothetical protein